MQGQTRVLQENVKDAGVTVQDGLIRIVAFLDKDYAWFFCGEDDFQTERVELGQLYGGGGRLINDGQGNSHLFWFVKQSPGSSSLLRHQTYTDKWSVWQTVSTNVFSEPSSFSVAWHNDHYLHLVYCGHKDQHLLYRVYNLEHCVWSGAVTFSEEPSNHPQFISAEKLYLFWQEDLRQVRLKVRHKEQNWSQAALVSTGEHHASNVGYALLGTQWSVLWGEGEKFFEAPFDSWSDRKLVKREDFDYAWVVQGHLTIPAYECKQQTSQVETPPQVAATPQELLTEIAQDGGAQVTAEPAAQDRAQKKKETEEAKLQAAFIAQAFRTLQEWEQAQREMQRWKAECALPAPVDLTPLINRVERLERRLLSMQQSHEQCKKQWEESVTKVEQELGRARIRLRELEDSEKKKQNSLWRRVLGRG